MRKRPCVTIEDHNTPHAGCKIFMQCALVRIVMNPSCFPNAPGTYAVLLRLDSPVTLQIGRLGECEFAEGLYAYIGSARGTGGLRARLSRHLRAEKALHWHIDYLTAHATITAIWWRVSRERLECVWARSLSALPDVTAPVPSFGSSDCGCDSHLFTLPPESIRAAWETLGRPAATSSP
jgi:Uri superfamily endonuclease